MVSLADLGGTLLESLFSEIPGFGASFLGDKRRRKEEKRLATKGYQESKAQISADSNEMLNMLMSSQGTGIRDVTTPTRVNLAKENSLRSLATRNLAFGGYNDLFPSLAKKRR